MSKEKIVEGSVLLSYEINETAVFIREISEHCLETCTVWSHQQWLERDWLTEDITKEEKFLINWPCINSFCAQLMLKSTSLKQLLLLPVEHLKHRFHWLPHHVIEIFHQVTNKDGVLNKKQVNLNKILPDKVATGDIGNSHHKRKTISIGLAQPLMRNSQEAGFMASQRACSVINQVSETGVNSSNNGPSTRNQSLTSPESETQFLPSSQFYSGFISTKKRRLTFEKVSGQKDGQTKLLFS
ncbi:unnamed protein product [Acanthosepion pharaonis]|uniref:Uncharacterized protein n=1 Tax=Acanthosepion pharaonis TaxID=158019 RepID=A0A812EUE4_ACAPH|nr:unnamed protein product [Sepia pharaonis]